MPEKRRGRKNEMNKKKGKLSRFLEKHDNWGFGFICGIVCNNILLLIAILITYNSNFISHIFSIFCIFLLLGHQSNNVQEEILETTHRVMGSQQLEDKELKQNNPKKTIQKKQTFPSLNPFSIHPKYNPINLLNNLWRNEVKNSGEN